MNRRIRRRNKKHILNKISMNCIISLGCALLNMIIMIVMGYRSTVTDGNASLLVGLAGVCAMIISGYGIYYAFKGLKEDDNNYFTIPLISIISNILIAVILLVMYIVGLFL